MILAGIAFAPTLIGTAAGLVQIATGLAALTAALWANPIVLAIGAIAGGVYLIYRNWDRIKPYFQGLWDGVKTVISTVWDWFKTLFSWTPLGLIMGKWGAIGDAIAGPINKAREMASAAWGRVKGILRAIGRQRSMRPSSLTI